jgi:hypothetical protein
MAFGTGVDSSVGWYKEATFNTASAIPATAVWIPHDSESVKRVKHIVQTKGLRGGQSVAASSGRRIGWHEAKGNVVMDFPNEKAGLLLKYAMLGATTVSQIGASAAYTQIHTLSGLQGYSIGCQVGRPATNGTVYPFTYTGGKVTDWEISLSTGELMKLNLGLDFADERTTTGSPAGPALTTPSYSSTLGSFAFKDAGTLTLAGTDVAAVTKISIKGGNPAATERVFLGSSGIKSEQVTNDLRTVTGTLECEFVSLSALYEAFRDDTGLAFVFQVTGSTIGATTSSYSTKVEIPKLYLDGETPSVDGPGVLKQTIPFVGLYDGTNSAIKITYTTTSDSNIS